MNRQQRSPFFLLVCPKNLKECIDWVLRATERDKGSNDIDKLKKALEAELGSSVLTGDLNKELDALASGLGVLAGLPACLCKTKKSVKEGLKKIYEELKTFNCINSKLNCDLCSQNLYPCKCCVIQSIKAVKGCGCLNGNKQECHCAASDVSCAKVLAGLEACLHLQCLQADMNEICECNDSECCKSGKCNGKSGGSGGKSCPFCKDLKTPNTPVPTTGLGLSPPNPIRLAGRLETFFGGKQSFFEDPSGCTCKCNGKTQSCCCLACPGNCSQACSCKSKGSCKTPQNCPCKTFCIAINDIKVPSNSDVMTCCESGTKCHCQVDTPKCSGSPNCCDQKKKVKCLIRRVVSYFKDFPYDSSGKFFKSCCEFLCVLKTCEFLKGFYDKRNLNECKECKSKGTKGGSCPSNGKCCEGSNPQCPSGSSPCSKCSECRQICDSKKFYRELQTLQYSGPCGQDLYRVLYDFLYYCFDVFYPRVNVIRVALQDLHKKCQCPSGSCQCSSKGSSCQGCTAVLEKLQTHKDVLSLMTRGYFSSYDSASAKWDSLCSSGSKCCGVSSPPCSCPPDCSSTSSSCPKDCCENCPKRLCARIFLGMLPCLYYGLKILYDRSQDPVTWPDWQYISVYSNDLPKNDLAKFLYAWGYDLDPLKTKKGSEFFSLLEKLFGSDSSGPLQKLSTLVTENYFTSNLISPPKDPKTPPKTVRSMLLWLYGLRFQKHFSDLVENCKSLCSPFGNSFNADAFCYYIYTCSFILPVAVISTIETSDSAQKVFSSSSEFFYPSDPSKLFETFCEYVRKIFAALNFLSIQCRLDRDQGGWKDCYFGRGCVKGLENSLSSSTSVSSASSGCNPSSLPHGILCTSVPGHSNYHEHCISSNPLVKCLGSNGQCKDSGNGSAATDAHSNGQCTASCPHPLLMFLIDGSESNSKDYPFALPGIVPMGFDQEKLPKEARRGYSLYHDIEPFCKDGFYPLTRLVQFILCVSQRPPESFLDLYAFFKKFVEALKSGPLSSKFVEWIEGEPGEYSGSALKKALEDLYGSHSGSSHSPANLFSLSECHANKGSNAACGAYLFPLTNNVSGVFTPELCSMYLSWICYRAEKFYSEFQKFHEEAKKKFSCCKSCQKIVECPCALPFIYSHGFTFMSPSGLNCVDAQGQEHVKHGGQGGQKENDPACTRKTCSQFITQLRLVAEGQPFKDLLKEIEKFLWSIRLPFFFGFLYVWFFVLSYFFYVILIKLDTVHTGSHLHLPRSFKILPSTLFSDASSKLKDLSYFTL